MLSSFGPSYINYILIIYILQKYVVKYYFLIDLVFPFNSHGKLQPLNCNPTRLHEFSSL